MAGVRVIADRFVRLARGGIVDLATGGLVDLHVSPSAGAASDRQRALRCSTRASIWHECLPDLLDYGTTDKGEWFQAFEAQPREHQMKAVSARARRAVTAFTSEIDQDLLAATDDVWPADATTPGPVIGMRLQHRACVAQLAELLGEPLASRPRRLVVQAARGSGLRTFFRAAARDARRQGIIPLSTAVVRRWPAILAELAERHLLLLHDPRDDTGEGTGEGIVLQLVVRAARGHMLLTTGPAVAADAVLTLDPLRPDVLIAAVHVFPPDALRRGFIARAAAASGGRPGEFVTLLRKNDRVRVFHVAEARSEYVPAVVPESRFTSSADTGPWLARVESARELATRGRRAAAFRLFKEASTGLRRRGMNGAAAQCELDTASLLFDTGRIAEAASLFRDAHAEFAMSDTAIAIKGALGIASANILEGRLEDAEAITRAARAQAGGRLPRLWARASITLARCLCWQSRGDDAERVLAALPESIEEELQAAALCVRARLGFARADLPSAGRAAQSALELCALDPQPSIACAARELLVLVHGKVADPSGALAQAGAAASEARSAGLRLRALTLQLARAEALHSCGRTLSAHAAARFLSIAGSRVPPLIRARIHATLARIHPGSRERRRCSDEVAAFARATGARALLDEIVGPFAAQPAADADSIFGLVERSSDGKRLVDEMLAWVRRRLDACGAAVYDVGGVPISCDGSAARSATVARVMTSRQCIPPWLSPEGLEAAAPVRYAGSLIAVAVARWRVDRRPDASTTMVLSMVAGAIAPAVRELLDRRELPAAPPRGAPLVGASAAIQSLRDTITRAGPAPFPVLIEGESGVGKELVARGMHDASPRRLRHFCAVNCAAVADDLLESELFGHVRGAFTGAHADRPGLFEQADGGTLFLDEIGELSPRAQAKLLRVLQEREIRRIGENITRRVDVRVIAATNRSLDEDVRAGRFRQDLAFRLAVVRVRVPPLRERREDVPLLVARYWDEARERARATARLSPDALAALARYDWPGNVRELQNVLAALAVHAPPRGRIGGPEVAAVIGLAPLAESTTLDQARTRFEQEFVARTMARCGGRRGRAARELGLTRQGMAKLLKRLDLERTGGT